MYLTINRNGLHQKQERECIKKIWEADPLHCPKCGGEMKIISFITDLKTIRKILEHLGLWTTAIDLRFRSCAYASASRNQEGVVKIFSFAEPLCSVYYMSDLSEKVAPTYPKSIQYHCRETKYPAPDF